MNKETQRKWAEKAINAVDKDFPDSEDVNQWQMCEELLGCALECVEHINVYDVNTKKSISLLLQIIFYLKIQAKYKNAIPLCKKALNITEYIYGREHPTSGIRCDDLGNLYQAIGKHDIDYEYFALAQSLYEQALYINQQYYGQDHVTIANSFHNLATLFYDKRDYVKALFYHQKALEMRECLLGSNHEDVAKSLNSLVNLYETQGDFAYSIFIAKRALNIIEQSLGKNHISVSFCLNKLAMLYTDFAILDQEYYSKALHLLERSLEIKKNSLNENHPDVLKTIELIAFTYEDIEEYQQALGRFQYTLEIRKRIYGKKHIFVAHNLRKLANVYSKIKNYDKAHQLFEHALNMTKTLLGENHIDVVTIMKDWADLYKTQQDALKSTFMLQLASQIETQIYTKEPRNIIHSNNQIGNYTLESYASALGLSRLTLETTQESLEYELLDTAICMNNLALLYEFNNKSSSVALHLYHRAFRIRKSILGKNHPYVAQSSKNIAHWYNTREKYKRALPFYKNAFMIFRSHLGKNHPNTQNTKENYETCLKIYQEQTDSKS
jgi:tetratricopeptide (TPR) repeat protein